METNAQTLKEMAASLHRSTVYLAGLQKRFELPVCSGAAYPPAYVAFLRGLTALRTFDVAEETLRELWHLEKKLLQLLHVDSTGSPIGVKNTLSFNCSVDITTMSPVIR